MIFQISNLLWPASLLGMLLEMDKESLNKLLVDDDVLETAVSRAKTKYLVKQHPGILPGKEDMGEEIYEAVHNIYPEHAAKITGKQNKCRCFQ